MARTAGSKRRVTCRAEALSQASSTASSKRFENGALLGNYNNERGQGDTSNETRKGHF